MNDIDRHQVDLVCRFINLGKPEYWIVDALVQGKKLDRSAALQLVSRITRGFEARFRRRRRMARLGLALLVISLLPLFLGLGGRRPPIWPGLFQVDSNVPYFLLISALIGAFFFIVGREGRGWRKPPVSQDSPQPLPPGQIPSGWPGPGTPELPPQMLPPGQDPHKWPDPPPF